MFALFAGSTPSLHSVCKQEAATQKKVTRQEAADCHLPGGAATPWHRDHHIWVALLGRLGALLLALLGLHAALGVLPVGLDCRGHNLPLILLCLLGCLHQPLLSILRCHDDRARPYGVTVLATAQLTEGGAISRNCFLHHPLYLGVSHLVHAQVTGAHVWM